MEVLRQPLETGEITIVRAGGSAAYPCRIMLVAAMNPCPCGFYGHPKKQCTCTDGQIAKYLGRVSGPMLDRIDLHVEVAPVEYEHLTGDTPCERSADMAARVERAREIQRARYKGTGIRTNADLTPELLRQYCPLTPEADRLFEAAFDRLSMSARAYDRILKVARTAADLADEETIDSEHILEAIGYRSLDRKYWKR